VVEIRPAPLLRCRICGRTGRRCFYAEHWKIGTIAAELGLHAITSASSCGNSPTPRPADVQIYTFLRDRRHTVGSEAFWSPWWQIPLNRPTAQATSSPVECSPSFLQMRFRYSLTVVSLMIISTAISLLPLPWPIHVNTSCSLGVKSEIPLSEHFSSQEDVCGWRAPPRTSDAVSGGRLAALSARYACNHSRISMIENRHCLPTLTAGILRHSAHRHKARRDTPSHLDSSFTFRSESAATNCATSRAQPGSS